VGAIAAVAAVAIAIFALPLAVVLKHNYRDQELLRLQRDTVAAARGIDLGRSRQDPVEFPGGGDRLAVYDRAGNRVADDGPGSPARADAVVAAALRGRGPSVGNPPGSLVAAVPLLVGERISGAIRAQRADAPVERRTRNAWLALAATVLGLIVLVTLAALALGRRLATPLEDVALAARRLGDGDFSTRAPRGSVAEVDEVAAALNATAARLGDLVERERAFTANASHQLRTPLAALRLDLEAMQLLGVTPTDAAGALAQVDRLQQTIETLLTLARDAPHPTSRCELAELVTDVEARWRERLALQGRPLRIVLKTDARRASMHVAPTVVHEILDVLIDNARRHGAGVVTVTVRRLMDWWALDVADEGAGVLDAEYVFTAPASTTDGHGIGLQLARSLAEAQGGRVTLTHDGPHPIFTALFRDGGAKLNST
jgi:signal transduction histidine kinase